MSKRHGFKRDGNAVLCLIIASLFSATSFLSTAAQAGDWPEFRGPTAQGHSQRTDLPTRWSPTKNVRWKSPIPGEGWSSPIVLGQQIFLTLAVPNNQGERGRSLGIVCLNAENGELVWKKKVFEQSHKDTDRIHGKNSHASPTPISDGKHIFIHFGTKGTACLTRDGDIVWKTRKLVYAPNHGSGSSPVLFNDLLIVNCDGADRQYVVGLDKVTGEIRWKTERPKSNNSKKFSFATALLIDVDGQKQLISPGPDSVVSYRPADGKAIWEVHYSGYSIVPRPVYGHGMIFMSTGFDRASLLAIRVDGQGDVTDSHVEWTGRREIPNTPSMILDGDALYYVSDKGVATCVDAKTGKEHWKKRLGGNYSASPLLAGGKIYFQSETGKTTIVAADTKYKLLAKNSLDEPTLASFAVLDSSLLIRTEGNLYRIEK